MDTLRREIIKTSLPSGREIETGEKGEGEHHGKRCGEEKTKDGNVQQPGIISIVNELGKLGLSQDVYKGCDKETRVGT